MKMMAPVFVFVGVQAFPGPALSLSLNKNIPKNIRINPNSSSYTRDKKEKINVLYAKLILTPYSNFGSVLLIKKFYHLD
jgi:hypothetical protein